MEAAGQEVLRVWEVGADEAELHFYGGPESAADISIWRVISRGFSWLKKGKVRQEKSIGFMLLMETMRAMLVAQTL